MQLICVADSELTSRDEPEQQGALSSGTDVLLHFRLRRPPLRGAGAPGLLAAWLGARLGGCAGMLVPLGDWTRGGAWPEGALGPWWGRGWRSGWGPCWVGLWGLGGGRGWDLGGGRGWGPCWAPGGLVDTMERGLRSWRWLEELPRLRAWPRGCPRGSPRGCPRGCARGCPWALWGSWEPLAEPEAT